MSTVSLPGRCYGEPRTNIEADTNKSPEGKVSYMTFTVGEYDFKKRGVNFYDCIAFGKTAELVHRFWAKNRSAVVEGNLDVEEIVTHDDRKIKKIRIVAHRVIFLTDGDQQIEKDKPVEVKKEEPVFEAPTDEAPEREDNLPF